MKDNTKVKENRQIPWKGLPAAVPGNPDAESKHRCMAAAMSILGDKWNPFIIQALEHGSQRFCRIQDKAGGVNPRTLSNRLTRLEAARIVTREVISEIPPHTEYRLTERGRALLPILSGMADWSERFSTPW